MVARNLDDKPEVDYLKNMEAHLKNLNLSYVVSIQIGKGPKEGAASADLGALDDMFTIDHGGRRLTIKLDSMARASDISAVLKVKSVWRGMRGAPTLRDRRQKAA